MKCKRDKRSRIRGRRTCGWGSRKKHRGSGQRGGVGMAGTGKKAGQKIPIIVKAEYFGKHGFKSFQNIQKKRARGINLDDIEKKLDYFMKKGIAKKTKEGIEIDLSDYKILSRGKLKTKIRINACSASKNALEKIKESGSVINLERDEKLKETAKK